MAASHLPTGGGVAEGFPKMKQHEEYARAEVLSLQRKAAELHAKRSKVKMWTNYTPTPTPTHPKTIDDKNLAGKAWTVRVGSQKPNFVNHVDWGSLMPPLKYQGDTNLCWAYSTATCAEALYFIETGERISVDIASMIESAKDTMSPDGTNLPESGFLAMAKGALCQQGWPPKEGLFFLGEVQKLLGEQEMKQALDFGPICAIMDWHPCMLSYAKFQETIVPPMPYGIELCTEDVCENEGKAVIKSCYFCGYGYGLHQVCIAGYGSSSTGKKYWIVHDSAFGKIRVERGLNAFGIEVSSMLNDEVRTFCALAGDHWPLAITRPLPPGKKWETFPARVKREEHQRIVQTSWSEGRLRNH